MPRTLIAVTDSPFPSLDPARAALARIDPELRMAASSSADDILAVAKNADAVLVTYAKLPGELLRQLTRCKVIGRFGLGVDNIDIQAAAIRMASGGMRTAIVLATLVALALISWTAKSFLFGKQNLADNSTA